MSTELRLAIAMRGGVSLAVWMGGACREIECLRRSAPGSASGEANQSRIYRRLLEAAGYQDVAVDVLAGTSAGGLNAVLLACSLVWDMPFDDDVRNVWLQIADIEQLTRRPWDSTPQSLLRGDEFFYQRLMEFLARRLDGQLGKERKRRVDLILTCTLFRPEQDRFFQRIGEPISDSRSWARFRFRHFPGLAAVSDFRGLHDTDEWEPVRRLAYAARSTSSYPVAFEPATILLHPTPGKPRKPGKPWAYPQDMDGVFSESSVHVEDEPPVQLIDGGVLDNIPIAWAIRSIAAASANRPVDRWLLYLQPEPPSPPSAEKDPKEQTPRLLAVAAKAHGIKLSTESLLDDVDLLRRYADAAEQRRQVTEELRGYRADAGVDDDAAKRGLQSLLDRATAAQDSYRSRQGGIEALRMGHLLEEPVAVTGPDPLPFGDPRRPLDKMGPANAASFLRLLHPSHDPQHDRGQADLGELAWTVEPASGPSYQRLRSPQALARTVATLLDWASQLDRCERLTPPVAQSGHEPPSPGTLAEQKLYPLRLAVELIIAAHDRLLMRRCDTITPKHLIASDTPIIVAGDAAFLLRRLAQETGAVARPVDPDALKGLGEAAGTAPLTPAGPWPPDGFSWMWKRLIAVAEELGRLAEQRRASAYGYLRVAARYGKMHEALVALELLYGPLRPDPLSETADINFHMISAANKSPLDCEIFSGKRLEKLRDKPSDKLSGNQLLNFAAFLSARWRQNDWIWGRLDAARSLVDLVTRSLSQDELDRLADEVVGSGDRSEPASVGRCTPVPADRSRPPPVDRIVRALHEEILACELPVLAKLEDRPPTGDPVRCDEKVLPCRLGEVGLETLGSRLARLRRPVARLGLVLWRALAPTGHGWSWLLVIPVQAFFAIAKPLVVPVALAALAPGYLAGAVVAWFVAVTLLTEDTWTLGHLLLAVIAWTAFFVWVRFAPKPMQEAGAQNAGAKKQESGSKWLWELLSTGAVVTGVILSTQPGLKWLADWSGDSPWWTALAAALGGLFAVAWLRSWVLSALLLALAGGLAYLVDRQAAEVDGLLAVYTGLALLVILLTWCYPNTWQSSVPRASQRAGAASARSRR